MPGLSAEQERQIKELIAQDQKIAAIKLYREMTDTSLKDAKDAIEAIELGAPINFPVPVQAGKQDTFLENRIKRLLAERKKIEAVRTYREAYKCGLKEAKDAVDLIQDEMRRETSTSLFTNNDPFAEDKLRTRSCLVLVIAILLVVVGGLVFFSLTGNGF